MLKDGAIYLSWHYICDVIDPACMTTLQVSSNLQEMHAPVTK